MAENYLRTTPVHKRSYATIQKILDAAEATFLEFGYDKTTTRLIAERANLPVGSLYHFFPNKKAILDGLAARHLDAQKAMHQAMSNEGHDLSLEDYIELLVEKIASHFEHHTPFEQIIAAHSSSPEVVAYVARFNAITLERTERAIAARLPHIQPATRAMLAATSVTLTRSLLGMSAHYKNAHQRKIIRSNIKTALNAIWAPYWTNKLANRRR